MNKPMAYKPTIGLEIHVELNTGSKMFCSCKNDSDEHRPNINICPTCTAQPGSLPVINEEAVRKVIKTGLALNCKIPEYSRFDRKNYFYPDLPKGYQISQLYFPLCKDGFLEIGGEKVRIREIHLEEDTGKLTHPEGEDYSLVDFNRAGVPLMELVTEPDIASASEAKDFASELQLIMRYLDVSFADMEKGQMRIEANVSVGEKGKLGIKVEIKNLNSFRAVEKGIDYEIERQTKILESGGKVAQETRGWLDEATASSCRVAGARVDDIKGRTFSQREKEEAHDYRYFPEPDLPPLHHSKEFIKEIKGEFFELPSQKRKRFGREYELGEKEIEMFVQNRGLGDYFEKVISELGPNLPKENLSRLIKLSSNYLITDLQGLLKGEQVSDEKFLITPENFAEFVVLINKGEISSKIAKMVLLEMFNSGTDPSDIIEKKGLAQISDISEIEVIINEVLAKNKKAVEDYKSGKESAYQFLVGQIMIKTKGKANPQIIKDVLKRSLTK